MAKGDRNANLRATRTQITNARTSAQARAFEARQLEKQKREAEARKLRAMQEAEKHARAKATEEAEASPADTSGGGEDR